MNSGKVLKDITSESNVENAQDRVRKRTVKCVFHKNKIYRRVV